MIRRTIVLFALLAACGKTTPSASGLAYVDPPASGWRLVKSAASTPQVLVLDLLPPPGGAGRGVALTLQGEPRLTWGAAQVGTVYALGSEPKAVLTEVRGADVVLGVFQKGESTPASYGAGTQPVLSVSLKLSTDAPHGTPLPLKAILARHLGSTGTFEDVSSQLSVGTLTAE